MNNAWRSPYSGQAQGNQFPPDDEYRRQHAIGMRSLAQHAEHLRNIAMTAAVQKVMTGGNRAMSIEDIKGAQERVNPQHWNNVIQMPITFAGRAAIARATARTTKEIKLADLMAFTVKYRERKHGDVIAFPAWLSEQGRKRLLDVANRS